VDASVRRTLRFLGEAFDPQSGRFLNLRDANGEWLSGDASEDCHARALLGLATLMLELPDTELAKEAKQLFTSALSATDSFRALRPISASVLACNAAIESGAFAEVEPPFVRLSGRLVEAFGQPAADWPWPEPVLTYENALMPRALMAAGRRLGDPSLVAKACSVLDWLIESQTSAFGYFSPVGNEAWWPRTGERSQFDQQPIEAATMVVAAADAFAATGKQRYRAAAESAYAWFLGENDLAVAPADTATGGCHDGLTRRGLNPNQGAESTLMWQTALERMRELRGHSRVDVSLPDASPAL
jgi:uncharacterized protein YyaL (SSP411 family)